MLEFENTKILVTGGAGFIGAHICDKLLEKGAKVVCLDNFLTGHRRDIEHNMGNPNFTLIEGDIRNLETCKKSGNEITDKIYIPDWQFDSKWTCVYSGNY